MLDATTYVGLSAQVALERRLDTIAQNVANLGTVGYRADEIAFEAVLSQTAEDSVAYASAGDTYISRRSGALTKTDNSLDVAVQGDGWFAMQTPVGVAYTRDGRMQVDESGALTTLNGYRILDVGRAPIDIDPNAGPPVIARDGMITQGGRQIGALGLFYIDPKTKLDRFENSGVLPKGPATEILDFQTNGVVQGFVEESNVNPVMELNRLISVSRAFDAASTLITNADTTSEDAIKILGGTS